MYIFDVVVYILGIVVYVFDIVENIFDVVVYIHDIVENRLDARLIGAGCLCRRDSLVG